MERTSLQSLRYQIMPDTDVLLLALMGVEPYAGMLRSWGYEQRLVISALVVHELYSEMEYSEIVQLSDLLNHFPMQVPSKDVYEQAAGLRHGLKRFGSGMSLGNALMAAQAIVAGAQLVTTDKSRYLGITLNLLEV